MKTKIEAVEKSLNFATALALFFPVLIDAMSRHGGAGDGSGVGTTLVLGITISIFIANYLFFSWRKDKFSEWYLNRLNILFNIYIACFAIFALLLGLMGVDINYTYGWVGSFSLLSSLMIIMVAPCVALVLMWAEFIIEITKK